jgi:redox-sensitive bicupin YhaK (pirin superfamily)
MLVHYPHDHRGRSRLSWLDSRHTFSFAEFYDPQRLGVSALRVINEDVVQPGAGFGLHPHRDMEILTYVISGALEHRDSLGNVGRINAGEVQRMSAGTGISHSEYNASADAPLHFLQIWIRPAEQGLTPSYEEASVPPVDGLHWLAAGVAGAAPLRLHQDARVGRVSGAGAHTLPLPAGRVGFLQVVRGEVSRGDERLRTGDGAVLFDEADPRFQFGAGSEALWFDLPPLAAH